MQVPSAKVLKGVVYVGNPDYRYVVCSVRMNRTQQAKVEQLKAQR